MKLASLPVLLLATGYACAYAPSQTRPISPSTTQLRLFGGGNKGGEKKGPGMMDQLAMIKKAQEMAQKKQKLDAELAAMVFIGTGADGKVTAKFKYIPSRNPMDLSPEYEAQAFEFDDAWYDSASPDELSAAVLEAIQAGYKATNEALIQKYATMQADVLEVMGGEDKS